MLYAIASLRPPTPSLVESLAAVIALFTGSIAGATNLTNPQSRSGVWAGTATINGVVSNVRFLVDIRTSGSATDGSFGLLSFRGQMRNLGTPLMLESGI